MKTVCAGSPTGARSGTIGLVKPQTADMKNVQAPPSAAYVVTARRDGIGGTRVDVRVQVDTKTSHLMDANVSVQLHLGLCVQFV